MTVLDFQARYIKTTYLLVSLLIQSKRWHNCSCQIWLTWHSVCAVFGRNVSQHREHCQHMAVINYKCVAVRTTVGYCTPLKKPLQAVLFKVSAGSFCAELSTRLFTKQEPKEFIQRNMHVFINIHQQGCVLLVALKLHSQFLHLANKSCPVSTCINRNDRSVWMHMNGLLCDPLSSLLQNCRYHAVRCSV